MFLLRHIYYLGVVFQNYDCVINQVKISTFYSEIFMFNDKNILVEIAF